MFPLMWRQAVAVRTAAWEADRAGSIPIAAPSATATAVRQNCIGGRRRGDGGGNPNHIAFQRWPSRLLDEVVEGKPATPWHLSANAGGGFTGD
jgi:hypothetical protein